MVKWTVETKTDVIATTRHTADKLARELSHANYNDEIVVMYKGYPKARYIGGERTNLINFQNTHGLTGDDYVDTLMIDSISPGGNTWI